MSAIATIETADGTDTINRDEFTESDSFVAFYDNLSDEVGVRNKVYIPTDRVIRIVESGNDNSPTLI